MPSTAALHIFNWLWYVWYSNPTFADYSLRSADSRRMRCIGVGGWAHWAYGLDLVCVWMRGMLLQGWFIYYLLMPAGGAVV